MKHTSTETVVIGGGISGLACARALQQGGSDFRLVSPELGGRMGPPDQRTHFGAVYVRSDYNHVLPLVEPQLRVQAWHFGWWDGKRSNGALRQLDLRHLPRLARPMRLALQMRTRYRAYTRTVPDQSASSWLQSDPFVWRYFQMSADEFVERHRLGPIRDTILAPAVQAIAFVGLDEVNAAALLGTLGSLITPSYLASFRNTVAELTRNYEDRVLLERVEKVIRLGERSFQVVTGSQIIDARNVVFAAPEEALREVYPLPEPGRQVPMHVLHVRGVRRKEVAKHRCILFRPGVDEVASLWKDVSGDDVIYAHGSRPDLTPFYESHECLAHHRWSPAVVVPGGALVEENPEPGIFMASDFNLCSLEDSYMSGAWAAHQIMTH